MRIVKRTQPEITNEPPDGSSCPGGFMFTGWDSGAISPLQERQELWEVTGIGNKGLVNPLWLYRRDSNGKAYRIGNNG